MSPRRANSLTARDSVIRTLAPGLVRAYGVTREQALEVLASLTEEERYILFRLKSKCTGKLTATRNATALRSVPRNRMAQTVCALVGALLLVPALSFAQSGLPLPRLEWDNPVSSPMRVDKYRIYKDTVANKIAETFPAAGVNWLDLTPWWGVSTHVWGVQSVNSPGQSTETVSTVAWTGVAPPPLTCPNNQYKATYWNNSLLSGSPRAEACESSIPYHWMDGGPYGLLDQFSAQWDGLWNLVPGRLSFTATTDDGMEVWFDGVKVISAWFDQGDTTYTATVAVMSAGLHRILVKWYENTGWATADVTWTLTPVPTPSGLRMVK